MISSHGHWVLQFCLQNIIPDFCDDKQVSFDGVDFNPKVQQHMLMFSNFPLTFPSLKVLFGEQLHHNIFLH